MATRDLVSLVFTANDKQVQNALTRTGKGLDGLGGQAEKSGGRVQKSFSGAGNSVKGLAGGIPGVGGALSALTSPAGAATAAIGLVVAGIGAAVGKVSSLEKELRPMIQRSNLSAESLQVLSKAANVLGSEDGLDGVTDSAQELQLRLAEASQDASGPAVAAFEKLGLSSADLIEASPEESFLAVITALQGVENAADKKFLADELLGGSSEKLSGVINASSEEFQGLTDSIRENGDIISNEGIANANAFNLALGKLGEGFGGIATQVGTAFIPLLTEIIEGITELWTEIEGPVLWVLGILTEVLGGALRNAFKIIAGAINIVAGILTGDFSQAWRGIQQVAQGVMNQIILIYNNTIGRLPGVSKIDMLTFADNVEVAADAVEDLAETTVTASETTVTALRATADAAEETADSVRDAAFQILKAEGKLTRDLAAEGERRLADALEIHKQAVQDRQDALDAQIAAIEAFRERERGFQADQLTELKEQFGITDVEYRVAQAQVADLTGAHYAELVALAEELGVDNLAVLHASNRKLAQAQAAADRARITAAKETADTLANIARIGNAEITQRHKDGSGQSGRPAPGPRNKGSGVMDFAYDQNGIANYSTIEAGAGIFRADEYGREAEARAWIAAHNPLNLFPGESAPVPGAQHGAVVLPRMGGTRVNVGEAGQAEAIVPLPDLAALAGNLMAGVGGGRGVGGGLGNGSGGGGREVILALDGERLGSVFLDQFNILQSENRLLVDLV